MWGKTGQFDEIADKLRSYFAAWRGAELTVVDGAHRGARIALNRTRLQIGADVADDIVLFGDALAPGHAEIELTGPLGASIKVIARGDAVEAEGIGRIAPGFEATLPLPARISLGGARIEARSRSPLASTGGQSHLMSFGFVMASVLAGGLVAFAASHWTEEAIANSPAQPAQITRQAPADDTRLREMIATAGLAGMVKVEFGADGQPVLAGRLEGERAAASWRRLLVALDSDPETRRIVNLVSVDREAAKPPAIGSVWRDGRPRVLFADGQRVAAGDKTASGWTVTEITEQGVMLTSPLGAPYRIAAP